MKPPELEFPPVFDDSPLPPYDVWSSVKNSPHRTPGESFPERIKVRSVKQNALENPPKRT